MSTPSPDMLMQRMMLGGSISAYDLLLFLIATPLLQMLTRWIESQIRRAFDSAYLPSFLFTVCGKRITLVCKSADESKRTFVTDCPRTRAVTHHLMKCCDLPLSVTLVGSRTDSTGYVWNNQLTKDEDGPTYLIGDLDWREIEPDLFFRCRTASEQLRSESKEGYGEQFTATRRHYDFTSRSRSIADINAWIDSVADKYAEMQQAKLRAKGNRYHFIYRGHQLPTIGDAKASDHESSKPLFTKTLLSSKHVVCFDRIEKLYHPHCARLKRDLAQLNDAAYFQQHGGKRKKGYLFHGPPGTGKTASVAALAAEGNRHILEVPWSRMETNAHLEDLLSIRCIDGVAFDACDLLILFDEIDRGSETLCQEAAKDDAATTTAAKDETAATTTKGCEKKDAADAVNEKDTGATTGFAEKMLVNILAADNMGPRMSRRDQLHMGTVLSRLDGVSNYDRIIFVGTTNHAHKLPVALLRDGRMTSILFDMMLSVHAVAMLRDFYGDLDADSLATVERLVQGNWLAPSSLRVLCDTHDALPELLVSLAAMMPPSDIPVDMTAMAGEL